MTKNVVEQSSNRRAGMTKKRQKLAFLPQSNEADPDPDHTLKLCTEFGLAAKS